MNITLLIGNLTKDPELAYTPNTQTAVCRFTLAVNRMKKTGSDPGADYIRITAWGQQAEHCDRYLSKGSKVAVRGRIATGSYTDRNGQTVYTTDVIAENVEFLNRANNSPSERRNESEGNSYQPQRNTAPQQADLPDSFAAADMDIPF